MKLIRSHCLDNVIIFIDPIDPVSPSFPDCVKFFLLSHPFFDEVMLWFFVTVKKVSNQSNLLAVSV